MRLWNKCWLVQVDLAKNGLVKIVGQAWWCMRSLDVGESERTDVRHHKGRGPILIIKSVGERHLAGGLACEGERVYLGVCG